MWRSCAKNATVQGQLLVGTVAAGQVYCIYMYEVQQRREQYSHHASKTDERICHERVGDLHANKAEAHASTLVETIDVSQQVFNLRHFVRRRDVNVSATAFACTSRRGPQAVQSIAEFIASGGDRGGSCCSPDAEEDKAQLGVS